MPKYKNSTRQIREGFISKMFGALATRTGKKIAANIAKKDPEMGKLLARAEVLMKQAEKRIKSMSDDDLRNWKADARDELGW
tara:strand:+ start:4124 stop:4369 length:246 start_codon:yes stop_codon:yes gene_type:complete